MATCKNSRAKLLNFSQWNFIASLFSSISLELGNCFSYLRYRLRRPIRATYSNSKFVLSQTMAATKRNAVGLASGVPRQTLNNEELVSATFQPSLGYL